MTLVIQANLERNLLHAQKTRLEQVLGALHAQQSQITNRRHAHIGFEDVTQTPDRKVDGLREFSERQFSANVFAHHLNDFFFSFIQADTLERCLNANRFSMDDGHTRTLVHRKLRLNSREVLGPGRTYTFVAKLSRATFDRSCEVRLTFVRNVW